MKTEEAIKLLKDNGYKYNRDVTNLRNSHYLYKRIEGNHCQCNRRPPNIGYEISEYSEDIVMSVKIRGESISGKWVDTGYYGIELKDVKDFKEHEYLLTKSWDILNEGT